MELFILADFNNIPKLLQNRGLVYIAERIISRLNFDEVKPYRRIRIRLYDGWYEQNSPTRKAQLVQANIRNEFPRRINIVGDGKKLYLEDGI